MFLTHLALLSFLGGAQAVSPSAFTHVHSVYTWIDGATSVSVRTLAADSGSYAVTGTDANLEFHHKIDAAGSSYTVSGASATLREERRLVLETGSYAVTGTDAFLLEDLVKIQAESGSYSVSGTDANLEQHLKVTADTSAYAITGTSATLVVEEVVSGDEGSYALTGTAASLEQGYLITAETTSYTITGTDAVLNVSAQTMAAESGSYTVSGTDANLEQHLKITADGSSYSLTGTNATLLAGAILSVEGGTYSLTGTDASLEKNRFITAESGSYSVSGTDATLLNVLIFSAEGGAYNVAGTETNMRISQLVTASSGSYSLSGSAATLAKTGVSAGASAWWRRWNNQTQPYVSIDWTLSFEDIERILQNQKKEANAEIKVLKNKIEHKAPRLPVEYLNQLINKQAEKIIALEQTLQEIKEFKIRDKEYRRFRLSIGSGSYSITGTDTVLTKRSPISVKSIGIFTRERVIAIKNSEEVEVEIEYYTQEERKQKILALARLI